LGAETFSERPDGPEAARIRTGTPYLRIAAVVAIAAGILGAGILGPHPSHDGAASSASVAPSPGSTAVALVEPTKPASRSGAPEDGPRQLQAITGLRQVPQVPGETLTRLPLQITSQSFAIVGTRLFYVVETDRIESSVIDSAADPQTLVTVGQCQAIDEIAAAGRSLLYVVTFPGGPSATIGRCAGFDQMNWEIWLMDLPTGHTHKVASGIRQTPSSDVAEVPIHIALTADSYAFDRPVDVADPDSPETVEVHAMDGRLLWSASTGGHVADVLLGGGKLAVVTQPLLALGTQTLWLADSGRPRLLEVAEQVTSAALSADGSFLSWDTLLQVGFSSDSFVPNIGIEDTRSGAASFLPQPTTADIEFPSEPIVSLTAHGVVAAWFATAPDGTVYPAFSRLEEVVSGSGSGVDPRALEPAGRSGFLVGVQQPVWMTVQGSSLIWVAEGIDGRSAIAFEANLDNL
jgi:hypothetical protein